MDAICDSSAVDSEDLEYLQSTHFVYDIKGPVHGQYRVCRPLRIENDYKDIVSVQLGYSSNFTHKNYSDENTFFKDCKDAFCATLQTIRGLTLEHCRRLELKNTWLRGSEVEFVANCTSLTSLCISLNHYAFDISALRTLRSLVYLTFLDLSYNKLTDEHVLFLADLTDLTSLNLEGNELSKSISTLSKMTSLTALNIAENEFCEDDAWDLNTLRLIALDVSGNNNVTEVCLRGLSSIERLSMMDVTMVELWDSFKTFRNLKTLDISHNNLKDNKASMIVENLYGLVHFKELDLCNNGLTDAIVTSLEELCQLSKLALELNKLSRQGFARLQQQLKNTQIRQTCFGMR